MSKHNGRHFADDIFKLISLNDDWYILIKLKFVAKGLFTNMPVLGKIMARIVAIIWTLVACCTDENLCVSGSMP